VRGFAGRVLLESLCQPLLKQSVPVGGKSRSDLSAQDLRAMVSLGVGAEVANLAGLVIGNLAIVCFDDGCEQRLTCISTGVPTSAVAAVAKVSDDQLGHRRSHLIA
jgi:hypothetical protein